MRCLPEGRGFAGLRRPSAGPSGAAWQLPASPAGGRGGIFAAIYDCRGMAGGITCPRQYRALLMSWEKFLLFHVERAAVALHRQGLVNNPSPFTSKLAYDFNVKFFIFVDVVKQKVSVRLCELPHQLRGRPSKQGAFIEEAWRHDAPHCKSGGVLMAQQAMGAARSIGKRVWGLA